ncbi:MAG: heavy metal translocating P-type ATPase [Verrucomicrobia bacterium]|nr:heavy metal translocating P-type ATPase [Verrucomicrobiota bacterium]
MAATYVGVRLYEKYQEFNPSQTEKDAFPDADNSRNLPVALNTTTTCDQEGNRKNLPQNFSRVSLASVGLFAISKVFPMAGPFAFLAYLYAVIPYLKDVEKSLLKDRKVNVDVLFFIGDVLTLAIGNYFTAALGLWMMHSGKIKVRQAKEASERELTDIFEKLPNKVWILVDGIELEVPLDQIRDNDIVLVNASGVIPVDGKVVSGMASVDQKALTGESQPAEKGVGNTVLANTMVITGNLQIQVEKSGRDTTASQINKILLNSASFKSGVQLKGEEWADMATLPMLGMAGLCFSFLGPVSTVVFINSHIGNRIRVLAPMGTLNHIAAASRKGILVKDGRVLENLHRVDTVLFDKTGTLTMEKPKVVKVIGTKKYADDKILFYAATAEQKQSHPIAQAIVEKAEESQIPLEKIHHSKYKIGYGTTVTLKDVVVRVGSLRFLESEGIPIPDSIKTVQADSHLHGNTLVLVGIDDKVGGAIELQAQLRPEAKMVVDELRQQGIRHMAIVSGDHREPTRRLAEKLDMDDFFSEVLPEDKAQIVEQLQKEGRNVCFVGDGINDAIAMKRANASISLAGASTIAIDVAEIVFTDGSLSRLPELFDYSKSLDINLNRVLKLTVAPGFINMSGAFFFGFGILTSLFVTSGFFILAMKYALLPLKKVPRKQLPDPETQRKRSLKLLSPESSCD